MPNLYLKLIVETVDFSNGLERHFENILNISYMFEKFDMDDINYLYNIARKIKGDWTSFNRTHFNNNYFVDITLIFHGNKLMDEDNKLILNIKDEINKYFSEKVAIPIVPQANNDIEILDNIFEKDGFILSIGLEGSNGLLNYDHIVKSLKNNSIEHEVLSYTDSKFDGGASGGMESIILFIFGSIGSGLTWDAIRMFLSNKICLPLEYLNITKFDNFKFKKMRSILAERIGEDDKNLILKSIDKDDEVIKISFESRKSVINLICDKSYNVIKMKVKNK